MSESKTEISVNVGLLKESDLEIISGFELGEFTNISSKRKVRSYRDYEQEAPAYRKLLETLKRFSVNCDEGCYKCDLYESNATGVFIPKKTASSLILEACVWRGKSIHPKASETFLGHFICIRCLASILIGQDPVNAMRSSQKWELYRMSIEDNASSYTTAPTRFSI
ncbi:MAG: protein 4 [Xinjiang varicosavirus]|uniref:Protein 4 n=1 Tax=Xinjiang varicosavirus TaxID=3071319 RepID=A0AAJ4TXS2_9RHAB|nr:MAG: protein 4 [Xinjiang varicosa-like virus]QYF49873.1 MAG: protein 4 [Xinjiang varicosa-like virus]